MPWRNQPKELNISTGAGATGSGRAVADGHPRVMSLMNAAGSNPAAPAQAAAKRFSRRHPGGRAPTFADRYRWLALLLALAGCAFPALSQTNAPAATPLANRYLLVIETSRAMQRRADAVQQVVQDLLGSKLTNQLVAGDTLGLWTFNEELSAGRLPLQRWSAGAHAQIAERVLAFLRTQTYEKSARFSTVLPALQLVTRNSEFLTVLLLSTGEEIHGTPFDEPINASYQRWRKQQQDSRMPFITALRAQKGTIVEWSVTPAPWPIELPAIPADLRLARARPKPAPAPSPMPAPPPKPLPSAPPIILSGKKTGPVATNNPVAPAVRETASVSSTVTNPAASKPPEIPASLTPAVAAAVPTSSNVPPAGGPEPAGLAPSQAAPAAPALHPPPVALVSPAPTNIVQSSSPAVSNPPATITTPHSTVPVLSSSGDALPPASAASSARPEAVPTEPPADPQATLSTPALREPTNPPAAQVAALAPQSSSKGRLLWLLALAAALGGGVLVWWWRSRARSPEHVSLITRSLDQKK